MGGSWVVEGCKQAEGVCVCVCVQVALHELSKCLPEEQRPMPAHLVEVADNNTSALPNTGMDAGYPLSPFLTLSLTQSVATTLLALA